MSAPPGRPKIYHIVNVDRLPSIIGTGALLSDSEIINLKLPGTTIGMGSIKERRHGLPVKCYSNANVGEFVPFYFCPRSVMLFVIHCQNSPELTYKGGQGPIVHLECDLLRVIDALNSVQRSWAFSASNAGAAYTQFWRDTAKLDQLEWDHIAARQWREPHIKEAKQSEFLVYKRFSWHLVDRVGVQNRSTYNEAVRALGASQHKPSIIIEPNWYY